jgi:peptide/nickel transport system ATP-binding protein
MAETTLSPAPAATAPAGLSIEGLGVAFEHGRLEAITDLSLEVRPGEAVGLVGESGSGKSLMSRAVLGLLPAGASGTGRIVIDGVSVLDLPPNRLHTIRGSGAAMIFQDPMSSLNPVLRVGDAVAQVVRTRERIGRNAARRRAIELMEHVGIRDTAQRAQAFPHEFSGGMRQRVMIAMALAARPRLLLADEPTTALDVVVQASILELLDRVRRETGMGLLLVSHDLAVVSSICDRVAVMYAGQIVELGMRQDVLHAPRMPYTAGLLASTRRQKGQRRMSSIAGSPPQVGSRPAGCRFEPRCPLAIAACKAPVSLVEVAPGHFARCIRSADVPGLGPADFGVDRLRTPVGDEAEVRA